MRSISPARPRAIALSSAGYVDLGFVATTGNAASRAEVPFPPACLCRTPACALFAAPQKEN